MSPIAARAGPHLLLAALCAGLAGANLARVPVVPGSVAAGLLVAASGAAREHRLAVLAAALALAGLVWGGARLDALDRSPLTREIGYAGHALLVITGPAKHSTFDIRIPAEAQAFHGHSLREPVLLKLPPGRAPPQGALVDALVEVTAPRGPKDGFDEATYLRRHGIHVVLRGSHLRLLGMRGGLAGLADRLRRHIGATMAPGLRGERRAVVAGIVLGEDQGLSKALADAFRASGLYHLLAVSGQNVLIIVGGVVTLSLLLGVSRLVGEAVAIIAVLGYLAAVGWQPSVVRAGVAGLLGSLAWLTARPRDRWYFLLVGAAVLLAWNPYALLDPGFQLSFGAVVAIFLGVARVGRRVEGYPLPRMAADALTVSLVCSIATAPILLLQFGAVPLYALPANILAAPAVAPLLGCALISAAIHPVLPAACAPLAQAEGLLAAYLAAVARAVAALPYARLTPAQTLVGGCLAVLAVVAVRRSMVSTWRPSRSAPPIS